MYCQKGKNTIDRSVNDKGNVPRVISKANTLVYGTLGLGLVLA
jgi:hypothetical protein